MHGEMRIFYYIYSCNRTYIIILYCYSTQEYKLSPSGCFLPYIYSQFGFFKVLLYPAHSPSRVILGVTHSWLLLIYTSKQSSMNSPSLFSLFTRRNLFLFLSPQDQIDMKCLEKEKKNFLLQQTLLVYNPACNFARRK